MSLVSYLGWGDICSHLCRNRIVHQIVSEWLFTKLGLWVSIGDCLVCLNWWVKTHANYRQNPLAAVKVKAHWSQQALCSFIQFVFTLSVELVCLASTTCWFLYSSTKHISLYSLWWKIKSSLFYFLYLIVCLFWLLIFLTLNIVLILTFQDPSVNYEMFLYASLWSLPQQDLRRSKKITKVYSKQGKECRKSQLII